KVAQGLQDNGVADILQTLRDLGIDDNTLVIFTSDNGTHNESGTGGTIAHDPRNFDSFGVFEGIKRDHWEGGIRMPTFAWWPTHIGDNNAATPAANSTRPSAFWDWMPTIVDAAGATPPAWSSGVSLLPELTGTGTQLDKGYLYFEYSVSGSTPTYTDFPNHGGETRGEMQVIFMDDTDGKRYKGIRTGISSHATNFQIYDVDADPGEVTDLAASRTALQQKMKDKVLQVRIDGDYSRPYSSENVPDVSIPAVSGLNYKAFTGSWDWVPETDYLVPVASGECTGLDLTKRTQDDNIALEFTGYIRVPTDGTYTFSMTTDSTVGGNTSGGMLWIHDAHIIDDDFHHTGASKSGTMRLKAGLHPIRVLYKHATGSHDLTLQYSGPGISMQPVPDSALLIEGVLPPGPPVANDDSASTIGSTTGPGASVLIDVLANDIDDGTPGPLTITDPGSPLAGVAVIESAKIRYTPNQGFFGTDQFVYTISDGQDSDSATVTVDVAAEGTDYWYPLDEASGTIATEAGGVKPASLVGFDSDPAQWVGGKFGNAVVFDGSNDHLSIDGYKGILGTDERTVSAWIKTTGTSSHPVIAWGPNANDKKWTFLVQGGNLRIEVTGGYRQGATVINNGSWHHVACTFAADASPDVLDAKLYIDGVLETNFAGSASQTIGTTASLDVRIGSDVQSRYFVGSIDDPRIYTRALAGSEIEDLAAQTLADNDSTHWYLRNLGNAEPTLVDWETDSNGDGYSHYAAYALGGSPHWFVPGMVPLFEPVPAGFEYLYNRRRALDPSDYILETALALVDPVWSLVTGGTAADHPELADYEVVTVPISTDGKTNSFYRLKIAY
ncbi:MAG: sulfatase-like hydrolase/transferase, partial [Verrucomicrobia bacterium]|nr:sulfatase-like hydrolase/transferase [Verrucomicrobiota bacterium]